MLLLIVMLLGAHDLRAQEPLPIKEALRASADEYIAKLKSPDPDDRAAAAITLGLVGSGVPGAESALLITLRDPEPRVRAFAALALPSVAPQSEAVRKTLESRLGSDGDPIVRSSVAAALGELAHPGSVGSLAQALSDTDVRTRLEAVRALAAIEPSAVRKIAGKIKRLEKDPDPEVRAAASDLVLKLKPKK